MRHPVMTSGLALVAVLGLAAAFAAGAADAPATAPVVVELFTSQGCSSCPPADRLLSRLGASGERVVPLAFHVDYWNSLGWPDPFSARDWSARQSRYAGVFGAGRVYTPQLVVNGRRECVGSDQRRVEGLLEEAQRTAPGGRVEVEAVREGRTVHAVVAAEVLRPELAAGELELVVALFESGLETAVARGENARRTLHDDYVVRLLEPVLTLPATSGERREGEVTLRLEPGWGRGPLGVAALLQDRQSLAILGAGVVHLAGGRS